MRRKYGAIIVWIAAAAVIAGCSGPLHTDYKPGGMGAFKLQGPATVLLKPYADMRAGKDPKNIGDIKATVSDMTGESLILDKDVSTFVTSAVNDELFGAGFNVIAPAQGNEGADYVMEGEIRQFRFDIGPRDKIGVEIFTRLKDTSGRVVWSGVEKEEAERYAGVMGNSRRTISDYIVKTLSSVIRKTIKEAAPSIKAAPSPLSQTLLAPGKEVGQYITDNAEAKEISKGIGTLSITTEPRRAKVYIGDVYYGLTPIAIDLPPATYEVRLKMTGYKDQSEKVAVREGYKTEMEVIFVRE
ncbi:MAG: PEGA domain-containing protein [Deltaproteobacteria bacterium]|nr:PEGA domain-containing protein [Deltaproteobacteria bacterium]